MEEIKRICTSKYIMSEDYNTDYIGKNATYLYHARKNVEALLEKLGKEGENRTLRVEHFKKN